MADPQLLDYIQKARQAKQADEQSRTLLSSNGWTEAEINDAFASLDQSQPKVEPQVQQPEIKPQPEPQLSQQPEPQIQPQEETHVEIQHPEPQTMPTQAQVIQDVMPTEKKKSHLILKLLIVLIILIVIGGAGYFAAAQYLNFPLPFNFSFSSVKPQPEVVISKAWDNLKTIKSENFNSTISFAGKNVIVNGMSGDFNLSGNANGGVDTNSKLADLKVSLSASATDAKTPGNKYAVSLMSEAKIIQKDLYLQLSDINLGALQTILTMSGGPDVTKMTGQWVRFQNDQATQQDITDQIKGASGQEVGTTQEQQDALNKIVKILLDKKVYDISQLADNNGTEGKEYHYSVSLNQQKLIAASPDVFNVLKDYYTTTNPGQPLSPDMTLESLQKGINEAFDKVGSVSVDLFIGQKDNFFHKIQFSKSLDISKFDSKSSGNVTVSYEIDQAGINQPVVVAAPDKFVDAKDFFSAFASTFALKGNISQLGFMAEGVYSANKSYASLCSRGMLNGYQNPYGKNLIDLNNSIVTNGAKKPACFSDANGFCISIQLTDGSFMCIDKTGVVGKTKCVSATTVCK